MSTTTASPSPSILLIGASGYIGTPLVLEFLLRKSSFSRLAILTTPEKASKFSSAVNGGFELIFGSFLDASSFVGFEIVISLLGTSAWHFQPAIITACVQAGVKDFYPSEYGCAIEQGEYFTNPFFAEKLRARAALQEAVTAQGENGTFNYTLMVVGIFMEFLTTSFCGCDLEEKTFTYFGDLAKSEGVTGVKDVARYIVSSTLLPKSTNTTTRAREFRVTGGVYSWREIIAAISKASGIVFEIKNFPSEEADRLSKEAGEKGDVAGSIGNSLLALFGREGQFGVPKPWDHELFPDIVPQGLDETFDALFEKK